MKKLNQSGFSGIEIALTIIVIVLIGGSGYLVYQRQQDKKEQDTLQKQVNDQKKQNEEAKPIVNEDEEILKVVNCDGAEICKVQDKKDNLAWVQVGGETGGGNVYLSKSDGSWKIIYEGNGDVPQETISKYDIPVSWTGPITDVSSESVAPHAPDSQSGGPVCTDCTQ